MLELARELSRFSGSLGAAYFDPIRCVIRVLEDTLETSHFDSTNMRRSIDGCSRNAGGLTRVSPGTSWARPDSDHEEDG